MFEELKKKRRADGKPLSAKAITAWVLFGAIILVFVFLDMNPGHNAVATGGVAARVNSALISQRDVMEATDNLRRNPFFAQFGEMDRQLLQGRAVQGLINSELIAQAAQEQGLVVTDAQIRDLIVNEPFFQEDDRFRRERYMGYLAAARKTAGEFEEQQRKDQMRVRAERLLFLSVRPTAGDLEKLEAVKQVKANAEFVAIPADAAVKPESLPAADVAEFLKNESNAQKARDYYEARKKDEFTKPADKAADKAVDKSAGQAADKSTAKAGEATEKVAEPANVVAFEEVREKIARKLLAAERSEKALDEVRVLVKGGDMAAVEKWMARFGYKWEETGVFTIDAESVPKVGANDEFIDGVFSLNAEKPLLDKLIRHGGNTYIVRHKAATGAPATEDPAAKPEMLREMVANQSFQGARERWIKQLRDSATVHLSEQYQAGAQN